MVAPAPQPVVKRRWIERTRGAWAVPTPEAPPEPPPPEPAPASPPPGFVTLAVPAIIDDGSVARPSGVVEGGHYDGDMIAAVDTVLGAVVSGSSGAVLVHHGQRFTEHRSGPIAAGRGGTLLAVTEYDPSPLTHAVDLTSGVRHSLPGTLIGVGGDDVYLRDDSGRLRWQPGSEPSRLERDPLTLVICDAGGGRRAFPLPPHPVGRISSSTTCVSSCARCPGDRAGHPGAPGDQPRAFRNGS